MEVLPYCNSDNNVWQRQAITVLSLFPAEGRFVHCSLGHSCSHCIPGEPFLPGEVHPSSPEEVQWQWDKQAGGLLQRTHPLLALAGKSRPLQQEGDNSALAAQPLFELPGLGLLGNRQCLLWKGWQRLSGWKGLWRWQQWCKGCCQQGQGQKPMSILPSYTQLFCRRRPWCQQNHKDL